MRFLFLALISLPTFAMPKVGDYAEFATYDGYSKVAEILSYDKANDQFRVKYTMKYSGMIITEDINVENATDMMNEDKIEFILTRCEIDLGGHREDLHLSMGNFETCKLTDLDTKESFNIGRVPFGVLAMELVMDAEPDNTMKKFTLQKYHNGK